MEYSKRVHIVPIGQDDIKRIVLPAKSADKIYLITKSGKDQFKEKFDESKEELLSQGKEIEEVRCDFFNFNELMKTIAEIFHKESERSSEDVKNQIFFNVSTGGKLLSIAGMISCMMFGGHPYYCKKDYENNIIPIPVEILSFPNYRLESPSKELIHFLLEISKFMKSKNLSDISKTECLNELKKISRKSEFTGKRSADYNKLRFNFLDKLEKRGLITINRQTRGKITINKEGEFALDFFSAYYGLK